MIIDVRGNVVAPPETYFMKSQILADRGWGLGVSPPSADRIADYAGKQVEFMEMIGTDVQFVLPRIYHLGSGETPSASVHAWVAQYNDVIAALVGAQPARLRGVGGLPQVAGESPEKCIEELRRCVLELGFVAVALNTDPGEGDGATPNLADPFWYPLFAELERLDVPLLLGSGAHRPTREGYHAHHVTEATIAALALIEHPEVFETFPGLKVVVGYGGGSVPYQAGRWRVRRWRQPDQEPFETSLRRLWFDTVLYSTEALELLFRTVGVDRCLFATQKPGPGSGRDPETNRWGDDVKSLIDEIRWLTDEDRRAIFDANARRVFTRLPPIPGRAGEPGGTDVRP